MTSAVILPLTLDKAPIISRLHRKCFTHFWKEKEFIDLFKTERVFGFYIFPEENQQKEPVGFILAQIAYASADVLTLAVDPAFRRRGYARSLLDYVILHCKEACIHELFLEASEENHPAFTLYERYGFEKIGIRKQYYPPNAAGVREDAISFKFNIYKKIDKIIKNL